MALAAAAALVFVVLGGGGWLAAGVMDGRDQAQALAMRAEEQRMMAQVRQTALETKVSGESVEWRNPDGGTLIRVQPVRTYRNRGGQFCREFRQGIERATVREASLGVACRASDGPWTVQFYVTPGDTL